MWEIIKHKLSKLGCFLMIALIMIGVTAGVKVVLGWLHFDDSRKEAIASRVGDYVGKGLLGFLFVLGVIFAGFQLRAELRNRRKPPVIGASPPPLPSAIEQTRRNQNK